MAYNNSGTIGVEDADILISLKRKHAPTADGPVRSNDGMTMDEIYAAYDRELARLIGR
jgi:hypothetical protein